MSSYEVYGKLIQYHKWKVFFYALLMIGTAVLIMLQVQHMNLAAVNQIKHEVQGETQVILYQQLQDEDHLGTMISYFNSISFSVLSMTAMGTILLLGVMENEKIRKRILYAPVRRSTLMWGEVGAGLLQIPVICLLHIVAAFILAGSVVLSVKGIMMILNMTILSFTGVGLAFILKELMREKNAAGALLHAITLIICFISGAFIPGYYLGNAAREFAAFTPVYWYVRANSQIRELQFTEVSIILEIFRCFGMQMIFGMAFYVVAIAVKHRKES